MTALVAATASDHHEALIAEVRDLYERAFPARESGFFTEYDWNRFRLALARLRGPAVLDIGVGAGQPFNVLARDRSIERLVGIDLKRNKKFIEPPGATFELTSVFRMPYPDRSFDSVLCMEVLEHLETLEFPKALHEIRRVCRGTLIMTVPYEEPLPLWHHDRPGGHRQQFTEEKIERWFPRADRTLVPRKPGVSPWIMLVEDRSR